MHEKLQQIRKDLRLSMNGVASKSMREKGLDYKLNFGVDILRLRQLAANYEPDAALADEMWSKDVRELKILATLLFPIEEFDMEKAEKWVDEIPNHEIREQVCMNLFQKLGFADKLVYTWIDSTDEETRTTGYWLLARLLLVKSRLTDNLDYNVLLKKMISDLDSDSYFLSLAAQNALKFIGRTSREISNKILAEIQNFKASDNPTENEIYQSLSFEFTDFFES